MPLYCKRDLHHFQLYNDGCVSRGAKAGSKSEKKTDPTVIDWNSFWNRVILLWTGRDSSIQICTPVNCVFVCFFFFFFFFFWKKYARMEMLYPNNIAININTTNNNNKNNNKNDLLKRQVRSSFLNNIGGECFPKSSGSTSCECFFHFSLCYTKFFGVWMNDIRSDKDLDRSNANVAITRTKANQWQTSQTKK